MKQPKVAVIGLGVGYALACCLAEAGYETVGVDIDPNRVANPRKDPSVHRLLSNRRLKGRIDRNLTLTTNYGSIASCRYVVVCVSTGDEKKLLLGSVEVAVREILRVLRSRRMKSTPILMVYSTLPIGSSERLRKIFREESVRIDHDVGYVHFPLMIAQGTIAEDFVNPPFVLFGSYEPTIAKRALAFYRGFLERSCLSRVRPSMFLGLPEEAEITKLAANAFLTTKIALSNEIGELCERMGIDGQKVMSIVGSDWRIGRKLTRPGFAVGGQCFPRDLHSVIDTCMEHDLMPRILRAVEESNEARALDALDKISGHKVLVLGTSYKEGVEEERGSKALNLVEGLRTKGYSVETSDPKFSCGPSESGLLQCETVIVTIPERAFEKLGESLSESVKVVLDYANIVNESYLPPCVRFWQAGRGWVRS